MPEEKIDHIAQLQKKLYARDPESAPKRSFGILRPLKNNVTSTWGEDELENKKRTHKTKVSGYKRLFIVAFVFFLLALGAALFSIYRGALTLSSKNVEVTILGNSFVSGGEALPIQIDMVNKNAADLIDAQITLSYPKGSVDVAGGEYERIKKPLGTIASGKTKSESFSVVLFGEQGTNRTILATLEYKLAGSNTVFVKEQSFSVMINSSPVSLTIDAPTATASNQPFTMTIRTSFSGDTLLDNAILRVEYPNGFVFSSSLPTPEIGTGVWALGDMVKGTEKTIVIKGKLIGEEQDEKSFRVFVGSRADTNDSRISVSYNSLLHRVMIAQPFISGSIWVGNQDDSQDVVALPNGSAVSGTVKWVNNASIRITNPVFVLDLNGETVDTSSIKARDAIYDSLEKRIIWSNETNLDLSSIAPGEQGEFSFNFDTLPAKPGTTGDIVLSLSVSGTFPDRDFFEDSISGIDQKIIRFASRLQFASQALYSIGPIKNTGPFPPKVDKETTYTISWIMKPSENALSKATAKAVLPLGVTWAGVISPQNEAVSYDSETRTVSWNIGSLPRATNSQFSRDVYFQVKTKPTKAQVDSEIQLLGETTIEAFDTVANTPLSTNKPSLTSKLSTDPAYSIGKEKVLP
ncbi:hypothetical protein IT402_01270 [Candidatus Nomurabacteria bacterium]|nr:hypothetical protein [Candidatus Nomurabacteria bacterium]